MIEFADFVLAARHGAVTQFADAVVDAAAGLFVFALNEGVGLGVSGLIIRIKQLARGTGDAVVRQ